jgi:hypothetical protein
MSDLFRHYEQEALLDDLKTKEAPLEDEEPFTWLQLGDVVSRVIRKLETGERDNDIPQ